VETIDEDGVGCERVNPWARWGGQRIWCLPKQSTKLSSVPSRSACPSKLTRSALGTLTREHSTADTKVWEKVGPSTSAEALRLTHPFLTEIARFSFIKNDGKCPLHATWVSSRSSRISRPCGQSKVADPQGRQAGEEEEPPRAEQRSASSTTAGMQLFSGSYSFSGQIADPISLAS
jgi:hypothetical protein